MMTNSADGGKELHVAVVGGGVAGTYCAWHLAKQWQDVHGESPKIALFEASDRIGGRLLSVQPPDIDTCVELGGMRYSSKHILVSNLVQEFKDLTPVCFVVAQDQNIAYLRRRALRTADLSNPKRIPYRLSKGLSEEQSELCALKHGWSGLIRQAAIGILKEIKKHDDKPSIQQATTKVLKILKSGRDNNSDLTNQAWEELAGSEYFGYLLRTLPLRGLMQRHMSGEALRFADDASGYNSILTTWNGFDGLRWNLAEMADTVKYFRIKQGFQQLPLRMQDRFERKCGSTLHLQYRLKRICLTGEGDTQRIRMEFAGKEAEPWHARHLILAMPRRSLELLKFDPEGLWERADVQQAIQSVTPIPLFKLALCYSSPWWQSTRARRKTAQGMKTLPKIERGQSVTDLPIRQCYYWPVPEDTRKAVVLVYDDGRDRDYWTVLLKPLRHKKFRPNNNFAGPGATGEDLTVPEGLVYEAHRQLLEMHGASDKERREPYAAAYRDWSEDPYGGGVNFWHLEVNSREVSDRMIQPFKKEGVNLYVCGEAYSREYQGWVEGALETAKEVVSRVLKDARPQAPAP